MNQAISYQKKLCMSEIRVGFSSFDTNRFFDTCKGNIHSSLIFVTEGKLNISSAKSSIEASCNDLLYIPEGIHYTAVWSGNPRIEFYSIDVFSNSYDSSIAAGSFALQKISSLSNDDTLTTVKSIFSLISQDDKISKLRSISLYYELYASVYPHLKPAESEKFSPVLIKAIRYIEDNFKNDFSVADVAMHCFVSESRLHHLFKSKLGTTPLRYRNEIRIEHASHSLRSTSLSLESIAAECGFNSIAYFRETFKQIAGCSPSEYRKLFLNESKFSSRI